jgi:hypothetical protein
LCKEAGVTFQDLFIVIRSNFREEREVSRSGPVVIFLEKDTCGNTVAIPDKFVQ